MSYGCQHNAGLMCHHCMNAALNRPSALEAERMRVARLEKELAAAKAEIEQLREQRNQLLEWVRGVSDARLREVILSFLGGAQ